MDSTSPELAATLASSTPESSPTSDHQSDHEGRQAADSTSEDRTCVPSACVACRDKHLKCDGLRPCTRCQARGIQCAYVRSQRGHRIIPGKKSKRARSPVPLTPESESLRLTSKTPMVDGSNEAAQNSVAARTAETNSLNDLLLIEPSSLCNASFNGTRQNVTTAGLHAQTLGPDCRERCIEGFFHFFYDSHPFVLPKRHALQMLRTRPTSHLELAMCYIGSQYVSPASTGRSEFELETSISRQDISSDGFLVQSLLLFAIGLDGNNDQKRAISVLVRAQNLALQLGMHQLEYAKLNSGGSSVVEESWRRTWWELYVVDGIIAGLHQTRIFNLYGIVSTVPLPCEEEDFKSGYLPIPHTIDDFDEVSFSNESIHWSSYTYRIAAVRNLGRILESNEATFPGDPLLDKLDAHLVNWKLHLPHSKKECFNINGPFDEMIFQAHMITEVSSILLNLQHAQFGSFVTQSITACAPHLQVHLGFETKRIHAVKAIRAAAGITKLIGLPTSLIKHTHFFTCGITLASIIHLSCWSASTSEDQGHELRQQIRMNMGALKAMAEVWPLAVMVLGQVSRVSQEIFATRKAAADVGLWSILTADDIMRSFIGDEDVTNDFQLM